jgi:hypothetical protein
MWTCPFCQAQIPADMVKNIGYHMTIQHSYAKHEHEWQPAGVTEPRWNDSWSGITYVWGMCKCGEITMRQWDS